MSVGFCISIAGLKKDLCNIFRNIKKTPLHGEGMQMTLRQFLDMPGKST
ncbi:hypothetical protein T4D_10995 [Trichinella pseudospiralis]|uniref:Uncharacterized protein n=1 Tax=Trichinella pseudospiralis TaxID=6337 RepID=A0A0V1F1Z0_TRIPS|nr:hypothetical protein T4D_10995 [Trichinella pseudospiralis]